MTELSDYKRMVERPMLAAKDREIGRLRSALVDIADPTLTADECKKIAREVLGWEPKQEVEPKAQ